jgi:hypothetical protein
MHVMRRSAYAAKRRQRTPAAAKPLIGAAVGDPACPGHCEASRVAYQEPARGPRPIVAKPILAPGPGKTPILKTC